MKAVHEIRLAPIEAKFADIVWENAPLSTPKLVDLCAEALGWARTTTYTVLRKCCERGIFHREKAMVTVLIPKAQFQTIVSEQVLGDTFGGSLPTFVAAFTSRNTISEKEIAEIRQMLDNFKE